MASPSPLPPSSAIITIPNLVSTSRVALGIGFMVVDSVPVRLLLIAVASITDMLDGWLARRISAASRIGALVDPLADRFFALCVVVSFVADARLTVLQAIAVMFRDVMSIIGWFVARNVSWLRPITFQARSLGKLVTALQIATFLAVLLAPSLTAGLVVAVFLGGFAASVDYTLMLWRKRVRSRSDG